MFSFMDNILLIDATPVSLTAGLPVGPYGLEIVKSWLTDLDVNVLIFNPYLDPNPAEALSQRLADLQPYLVGVSIRNVDDCLIAWDFSNEAGNVQTQFFLEMLRDILNTVKSVVPNAFVVLGGAAFSHLAQPCMKYLHSAIGVVGPGEYAFRQIAKTCKAKRDWDIEGLLDYPGVLINKGGRSLHSDKKYALEKEEYHPILREKIYFEFRNEVAVRTSYGCALCCRHCIENVHSNKVRLRPVENVIADLEHIRNNYPEIRNVFFADSELNLGGEERLINICREIVNKDLHKHLRFRAYFNPKPLSEKLLLCLHEIDMTINLTLDHVNDIILRNIGKDFDKDYLSKLVLRIKHSGIKLNVSLLFGHPEETERTILETIEFLTQIPEVQRHQFFFSPGIRIYPSTLLSKVAHSSTCSFLGNSEESFLQPVVHCNPFKPKELAAFVKEHTPSEVNLKPMNSYLVTHDRRRMEDEEKKLLNYVYGCTFYFRGIPNLALKHYEQMMATQSAKNSPPNLKIMNRMGFLYEKQNCLEKAYAVYGILEEYLTEVKMYNSDLLSIYGNLAELCKRRSDLQGFETYSSKYLKLAQKLKY